MRELRVAKSAGFCFGVSRSVKMAEEMLAAETNCYSLGELIHNDDVVQHLRSEGLTVADGPEQIPQGASVIIRSHGVSRAEFEAVQRTGATVYDATCQRSSASTRSWRMPPLRGGSRSSSELPTIRRCVRSAAGAYPQLWSMTPHSSPRVSLTAPSTVQNR